MDKKYQAILDKLEEIATNKAEHDKKLDTIIDQTRQLQDDYVKVKADIEELRSDFDEMHDISKNLQLDMERKVDVEFFESYKDEIDRKIDDLTNRSKRNNLVFWNVPEGDEKEKGCVQFIEDFLENHMKIPDVSEILIQKDTVHLYLLTPRSNNYLVRNLRNLAQDLYMSDLLTKLIRTIFYEEHHRF